MKKHIPQLLIIIGLVALCCIGCSSKDKSVLTLEKGVLSWGAVKDATGYEVSSGNTTVTCEKENLELSKICKTEGNYSITVSSVSNSGDKKEIGTIDVAVVGIKKPAVSITQTDDGKTCFVWKAEDGVSYAYNLHDGYGVQTADKESDGTCRVVMGGNEATMFTVISKAVTVIREKHSLICQVW